MSRITLALAAVALTGCAATGSERAVAESAAAPSRSASVRILSGPSAPGGEAVADAIAREVEFRLVGERGYETGADLTVTVAVTRFDPRERAVSVQATFASSDGRSSTVDIPIRDTVPYFDPPDRPSGTMSAARAVADTATADWLVRPGPEPTPEQVAARDCAEPLTNPPARFIERVPGIQVLGEVGCANNCKAALFISGYRYVEAQIDQGEAFLAQARAGRPPGSPPKGLIDKPGLYRFEVKPSGSPGCEAFERLPSMRPPGSGCISVSEIKNITARYSIAAESQFRSYSWGRSFSSFDRVYDAAGVLLGERRHVSLTRTDGGRLPNGSREMYCPAYPEPALNIDLIPPTR